MRFKILGIGMILAISAAPANAGSCSMTAHCYTYENGVHVLRGEHGPVVSQQALAQQQMRVRQEQQARELAAVNRLNASIRQQNAEIAALRSQVDNLQTQRPQRQRRRTYFGNPRFFGSNGFIGNSNFSGGTIQLPRRRRPRRPTFRPYK